MEENSRSAEDAASEENDSQAENGLAGENDPADESSDYPQEPIAEEVQVFWEQASRYLGTSSLDSIGFAGVSTLLEPAAWCFGDTPEMADELVELVLSGKKTATTSLYSSYEDAEEGLPALGNYIICDGQGHPRALICTTVVEVIRFDEVTEEHALSEGEGDGSLESWTEDHREFFAAESGDWQGDGSDKVVIETFELVYPRA